jgi:hypothetical protein
MGVVKRARRARHRSLKLSDRCVPGLNAVHCIQYRRKNTLGVIIHAGSMSVSVNSSGHAADGVRYRALPVRLRLCEYRGAASVRVKRALLMWVPIALALALVGATVGALIDRRVFHEGCGSRRLAPSQATTRLYCVRETQIDSTPALVLSNPRVASGDDVEDHEAAAAVAAVLPRTPSTVQKVCSFRHGIDVQPVCTPVGNSRTSGLRLATVRDPDDQDWNPVPIALGAMLFVSLLALVPALRRQREGRYEPDE